MKQFQQMKKAKSSQQGFTLIELVVVIVIAGILGSALVATYVDLSGEAREANFDQSIASINSAIALDIAKNNGTNLDGTTDAAGAANALDGVTLSLPAGATFTGQQLQIDGTTAGTLSATTCTLPNGNSGVCNVTGTSS